VRDLSVALTDGDVLPGEAYLDNTAVLAAHSGTQPDLFLRWNRIPLPADAIDVAVFLHGFSQQGGDMVLAEKVERSGLDLSDRPRPTLAMLPRGNWIRHYYYDFPALLAGGIDRLVDYGLMRFSRAVGSVVPGAARTYSVDRFILAAHSGGVMPAVDAIAGASRAPDEFHVFDGFYGRDPARGDPLQGLEIVDAWLADRLRREPEREGALRIIYIEQQTGSFSRKVGELIARHLSAADPARVASLSRRYRVETSGVQHSQIARRCMPDLLHSPDAQFNWLE
jgi:hypothetical protein